MVCVAKLFTVLALTRSTIHHRKEKKGEKEVGWGFLFPTESLEFNTYCLSDNACKQIRISLLELQERVERGNINLRKVLTPRLLPVKPLQIDQYTLQFYNRQSRVGVVELDSDLVGKLSPGPLCFLKAPHDVVKRRSNLHKYRNQYLQ